MPTACPPSSILPNQRTGRTGEKCQRTNRTAEKPADAGGRILITRAMDLEATGAARGDLVAGLPVDPDAADIGHEDARLAGDAGAYVPRVGPRIERLIADPDMRDLSPASGVALMVLPPRPSDRRRSRRSSRRAADRDDHVAQHRRAARAGDHEQVREADDGEPEIRAACRAICRARRCRRGREC